MSCNLISRIRRAFRKPNLPKPPLDLTCRNASVLDWPLPPKLPPHPGVRPGMELVPRRDAATFGWPIRARFSTGFVCGVRLHLGGVSTVWSEVRPDSMLLGRDDPAVQRPDSALTLYEIDALDKMQGDIDFKVSLAFKLEE